MERYTVSSSEKLNPGKHSVKFDFEYDGGGIGKGGMGTLYIDGKQVGKAE